MTTTTNYKAGQREFATWLKDRGIHLRRTVDLGLQRADDGWEHFAWELTVSSPRSESYVFPYMQGTAHHDKPTLVDVIANLLSDAQCATDSFEQFAGDLGYDTDSVKARELFAQIQVNNGRLLRLFGMTSLDHLLDQARPLLEAAGL